MSLFENDEYQWRETYFVLFDAARRPTAEILQETLQSLGERYRISEVQATEGGDFESLTVMSPDDYSAMDISYVGGEEVLEQVAELTKEMKASHASCEEKVSLSRLPRCTARLDVYHFEERLSSAAYQDDEDEEVFMDPGALLAVLEKLAELCDGIVVDPQSGSLM